MTQRKRNRNEDHSSPNDEDRLSYQDYLTVLAQILTIIKALSHIL